MQTRGAPRASMKGWLIGLSLDDAPQPWQRVPSTILEKGELSHGPRV